MSEWSRGSLRSLSLSLPFLHHWDNTLTPDLGIPLTDLLTFSDPDPWFMGTISDVKTSAQLLKGCVDNISTLGSEIKRNTGGVEVYLAFRSRW